MDSYIKPIADSVSNFRDKVQLFKSELERGNQWSLDSITDLFKECSDHVNQAKSSKSYLEVQIDALNAAMPKPPLVALMVKVLIYLAQELIALIQLIQAIIQVITMLSQIIATFTQLVINQLVAESISLALAVKNWIQEEIIENARKQLLKAYERMVSLVAAQLKKKKYQAKIKQLTIQVQALKKKEDTLLAVNPILWVSAYQDRLRAEKELEVYQNLLDTLENA